MASWVRLCHDPRDAPEAPVLLLIVTMLQSLVTTGPVTRREARHALHPERERERVCQCQCGVMSADTQLGETAELPVWGSNVNVSVIHPR